MLYFYCNFVVSNSEGLLCATVEPGDGLLYKNSPWTR